MYCLQSQSCLKCYRVPIDADDFSGSYSREAYEMNDAQLTELCRLYRGEEVDGRIVKEARELLTVDSRREMKYSYDSAVLYDENGEEVVTGICMATLRANFVYIDDLLDHDPEAKVTLPYPADIILDSLFMVTGKNSSDFYLHRYLSCIHHLNPTSALYYLRYNMDGISLHQLREIYSRLTLQERKYLGNMEREHTMPIPAVEMYELIPHLIDNSWRNPLVEEMLQDYPSVLFHIYYIVNDTDSALELVRTRAFTDDCGDLEYCYSFWGWISKIAYKADPEVKTIIRNWYLRAGGHPTLPSVISSPYPPFQIDLSETETSLLLHALK